MQPNTITLAVDILNTGSTVDRIYTRLDDSTPNRSLYIGPSHNFVDRDQISLHRVFPKRTGAFFGVSKASVKLTQDESVATADGGTTTAPLIGEVSFSIPVGTSAAALKEFRQRLIAILDRDDVMDPLQTQLVV